MQLISILLALVAFLSFNLASPIENAALTVTGPGGERSFAPTSSIHIPPFQLTGPGIEPFCTSPSEANNVARSLTGAGVGTGLSLLFKRDYRGIATVYSQGGALGSCGQQHTDAALIASVSPSFGSNALCGRRIRVINTGPTTDNSIGGRGNVVEVMVADTCLGCDRGHLDLSVGAWNRLTNAGYPSQVGISWIFI